MAIDNKLRQRYLQAIGVQTWELKSAQMLPVQLEPRIVEATESKTSAAVLTISEEHIEKRPKEDPVEHSAVQKPVFEKLDFKQAELEKIVTAVNHCENCPKRRDRLQALAGQGQGKQNNLDVFIITDPPVAEEDRAGVYLPAQAGVLFLAMLKSVGLIDRCYVSGLLKCHSLELFVPGEEEIQQCQSFLFAQIKLLKPKVLVSFGRLPAQYLLHTKRSFNELINQPHTVNIEGDKYPLIVTCPPGFLLRNPQHKKQSLNDLIRIQQMLS